MKRSGNSRSHAAMLGFQPFQRLERGRIADHARDLPAAGRVGGLALAARTTDHGGGDG